MCIEKMIDGMSDGTPSITCRMTNPPLFASKWNRHPDFSVETAVSFIDRFLFSPAPEFRAEF